MAMVTTLHACKTKTFVFEILHNLHGDICMRQNNAIYISHYLH